MKRLNIFPIIIFIIAILFGITFTSMAPSNKDVFLTESKDLKPENILLKSKIDLYNESILTFKEDDLNIILDNNLNKKDILNNFPTYITFKGANIYLKEKDVQLNSYINLKFLPLELILSGEPLVKEGILGIKINSIHLGKIPLPIKALNLLKFDIDNNTFYLEDFGLSNIGTINDIVINDNKLDIYLKFHRDELIDTYTKDDRGLKEIINLLETDNNSQKLGNDIFKMILFKEFGGDIPQELKFEILNDFKSLDRKTQESLLLNLLKYNLDYILQLIK